MDRQWSGPLSRRQYHRPVTSPPPVDQELLEFAATVAAEAATMTLDWFQRSDLGVDVKRDGTEFTEADRAAEAHIRARVRSRYGDDTFIGEEAGTTTGPGTRTWIVDPIDGTASFVRGVPLYSSLVAVFDEHGPAIGIVSIPALGESVVAGRGRGATHNGIPTAVSTVDTVAASCVSSSSFDQPWWPGRRYDVFVVQAGRLSVKSLEMFLVCQEETTFRQGTDVRTEVRPVHRQSVFRREDFKIQPGMPFEHQSELQVPSHAMHSFHSSHNSVSWKLVVRGEVETWPDFERSFPVIVYPSPNGAGGE